MRSRDLMVGAWVLAASVAVALAPSPVAADPEGAGAADAAAAAQARAEALVDTVVLPPGAVPVTHPPSPALAGPSESVAYEHAATAARLWVVPGSAAGVEAFFQGRTEAGAPATGEVIGHGRHPEDEYHGTRYDTPEGMLLVTVAPAGSGRVGIRADAQVPWVVPLPGVGPQPEDVMSADVSAYVIGRPMLRQRHVDRPAAVRLARLAAHVARDNRGAHHCPADSGLRKKLVLHATSGDVVFDGFWCGGTVRTGGGHEDAVLTGDVEPAIDQVLGPLPQVRSR